MKKIRGGHARLGQAMLLAFFIPFISIASFFILGSGIKASNLNIPAYTCGIGAFLIVYNGFTCATRCLCKRKELGL